jgi:peroxiredoxin
MSSTKLQITLSGALALGVALLIGNTGPSEAAPDLKSPAERQAAPDFRLADSRGTPIKLSDYRGKVVLLNFWATWCGPCKEETPWFEEFENNYRDSGFAVLGISMGDEGWASVRPFMEEMRINYPVMLGGDATASKYGGIDSLPVTLLIDRNGRIAARQTGITGKTRYQRSITELLRQ